MPPSAADAPVLAAHADPVGIRYACGCGNWAPLGSMFYSELCQKLVCRRPSCSVEEFESFYCSYLLVNLPSKEANAYQNRSSRCFACVACGNVLSTVFNDALGKYFFACAHCHWDSLEVELMEDDPDMLLMTAVAREREVVHEDVFNTLSSYHSTAAAAMTTSSSKAFGSAGSTTSIGRSGFASRTSSLQSLASSMKELQREQHMKKFRLQRMAEMGSWKIEQAVVRGEERDQWLEDQRREHEWPTLKQQLQQIDPQSGEREDLEAIAASGDMGAVSTLSERLLMPLDQPRDSRLLFPHRPLLRVKRTWRCIESIARGSAGILVKPQISPMSGDSSLPVPASWFKKANLGVHFVPVFTFQVLPQPSEAGGSRVECVLLIENLLDDAVQLVCQPGEATEAHAKVLLEDATPIVVGAYEDPTLADAFAGDARDSLTDASSGPRNQHLVSRIRNLAKIRVPLEVSSHSPHQIAFRLQVEMLKIDDALQEPMMDSLFRFTVELEAPMLS